MSALDPADVARLVKFLGMLGSEHDGERAAAAEKANALVRDRGLTWAEVFGQGFRADVRHSTDADNPKAARRAMYPERSGPPEPAELLSDHQREAWLLLVSGFAWDDWKRGFLRHIRQQRRALSAAQAAKLRECRAMASEWRERRREAA